jgi:hypothetical protein
MVFPAAAQDFLDDFDVYINGLLLRGGLNAAANFDYYYQSTTALRFEDDVKGGGGSPDVIQIVQRK